MKGKFIWLIFLVFLLSSILPAYGGASSDPKYGGRLNATISSEPTSLDIMLDINSSEHAQIPGSHIFEKLLSADLKGEAHPMLCTYEMSKDGLTLTLTMRENIRFHNGDIMDLGDIEASIDRWLRNSRFAQKTVEQKLDFIEYADGKKVVFHFKEVAPLALTALNAYDQGSYVMPKEIIEAAGDENVSEYIGTGPYKFVEWVTDRYIKLERFEDYQPYISNASGMAGTKNAYVDELYIYPVNDKMTRVTGVQTEDYDMALGVPDNVYAQLEEDPNLKCVIQDLGIMPALVFNCKQGATADVNFRQAVMKTLDMNELMLAAQGHPDFYYLNPCWMPKASGWWNDIGSDIYNNPDLEEAKRLLELTDYAGEELIFLTTKAYDYFYKTALLAADKMRQIGINVALQVLDNATLKQLRRDPNEYSFFSGGFTAKVDPSLIAFMNEGWPGEGGWRSERKSEIMYELTSEFDPKKRIEIWKELSALVYEELPVITFGERKIGTVTTKRLQNIFEGTMKYFWNTWVTE